MPDQSPTEQDKVDHAAHKLYAAILAALYIMEADQRTGKEYVTCALLTAYWELMELLG